MAQASGQDRVEQDGGVAVLPGAGAVSPPGQRGRHGAGCPSSVGTGWTAGPERRHDSAQHRNIVERTTTLKPEGCLHWSETVQSSTSSGSAGTGDTWSRVPRGPASRPGIGLRPGDIARLVAVWSCRPPRWGSRTLLFENLISEAWWAYLAAAAVAGVLGSGVPAGTRAAGHANRLARGASCRSGRAGSAGVCRDLDHAGDHRHVLVGVLGVVDRRRRSHRYRLAGKCRHR